MILSAGEIFILLLTCCVALRQIPHLTPAAFIVQSGRGSFFGGCGLRSMRYNNGAAGSCSPRPHLLTKQDGGMFSYEDPRWCLPRWRGYFCAWSCFKTGCPIQIRTFRLNGCFRCKLPTETAYSQCNSHPQVQNPTNQKIYRNWYMIPTGLLCRTMLHRMERKHSKAHTFQAEHERKEFRHVGCNNNVGLFHSY